MKNFIALVLVLAVLWSVFLVADLARVTDFETPAIARAEAAADDGGSGWYRGPGWSVYVEGNFLPDDELQGVTYYEFYLFGIMVNAGIRD